MRKKNPVNEFMEGLAEVAIRVPTSEIGEPPKIPKTRPYEEAVEDFNQREKDYSSWHFENYVKIRWDSATSQEKAIIKRAYNYILKKYDTNLKFEQFLRGVIMTGPYDFR